MAKELSDKVSNTKGVIVIVKGKKYRGKYVVLKSFSDNTVVAYGRNSTRVIRKAHRLGHNEAVSIYVPKLNERMTIYQAA